MQLATDDAETVQGGHAGTRRDAGIRRAAAAFDGQGTTQLTVDALGHGQELVACRSLRHRRQTALQAGGHFSLGDLLGGGDPCQVPLDPVEFLRQGSAHVSLGDGVVRNHVDALTGIDHGEVDGGLLLRVAQVAQLQYLVCHLGGGVTSQFRGDSRVRRPALDLHHGGGAALAPYHQAVARTPRLQVQRHVMLLGGLGNQVGGGLRAGFLAGIQQQGDLPIVLEVEALEDVQGRQGDHDAALVIGHTRAIGTLFVGTVWPGLGRAFLEYGIHVRQQEDLGLAGTLEGRHQMLALVRRGVGHLLHGGAELFQLGGQEGADFGQPRFIPGARIDVYQSLQQGKGRCLGLLCRGLDAFVEGGAGRQGDTAGKNGGKGGAEERSGHRAFLVGIVGLVRQL